VDCDKLLKQDIEAEDPQQMVNNLTHSGCFGLDSIDIQLFTHGSILGALIEHMPKPEYKMSYADLLTEINKAKKDTNYFPIRNKLIAMNQLFITKASPDTWEVSKKLLKTIYTSDGQIEEIHEFMLKNRDKNFSYRELLVFSQQNKKSVTGRQNELTDASNKSAVKIIKDQYSKYCDTGKLVVFAGNQVAFSNYSFGLECAKKMHKTALIFFNGRHSVNSRRLELMIKDNSQIGDYLRENYVIIDLLVDDKTTLPNSSKTVGEVNNNLEIEKFKVNYQPFFVIIDEHNNIKRTMGSTTDASIFLSFLKEQ
jgi:hypothetical protein